MNAPGRPGKRPISFYLIDLKEKIKVGLLAANTPVSLFGVVSTAITVHSNQETNRGFIDERVK